MSTLLQPREHTLQVADKLLPAVACPAVFRLLLGREARLLHAHEGSALGRDQCPNDDAPQPQRAPGIRELLVDFDGQDFAFDYAVPIGHGGGAETKHMAYDGLEVIVHQPFFEKGAFGESPPDFSRWVGKFLFDHHGTSLGCSHGSILLSRSSSWSKRSCQKLL